MNNISTQWNALHRDPQSTPKTDPLDTWIIDKYGRRITFVYKWPDVQESPDEGYNQIITCSLMEFIECIEEQSPVVGVFEIWREQPLKGVIKEAQSHGTNKQLPVAFWKGLDKLLNKYRY